MKTEKERHSACLPSGGSGKDDSSIGCLTSQSLSNSGMIFRIQ